MTTKFADFTTGHEYDDIAAMSSTYYTNPAYQSQQPAGVYRLIAPLHTQLLQHTTHQRAQPRNMLAVYEPTFEENTPYKTYSVQQQMPQLNSPTVWTHDGQFWH